MRKHITILFTLWGIGSLAYGYEGPSPLRDIRVDCSIFFDGKQGMYSYSYKVTNPSVNDGEIRAIRIFIERDPQNDVNLSSEGLKHCSPYYDRHSSEDIFQRAPLVPVGSDAPKGWSCGYTMMGSYGWGSIDEPYRIKPGTSLGGFTLTSYGPPGIREILIHPGVDLDRLPPEYYENVAKTKALNEKVKWTGKTVGPKAPPKVFVPLDFLDNLISLKHQALTLGWIDNEGVENSLDVKLENARKKIEGGDIKTAKNILNAFLNEVKAQNGKHLSSEAYALLYFNGWYLIDHFQ